MSLPFSLFIRLFFILIVSVSCGSRSLEEFKEEGRAVTNTLTQQLQRLQTREQLVSEAPKIKKLFNELIDISIEANEFREYYSLEAPELTAQDHIASDRLRAQLTRLYKIEGCREIIEKCQEESLHKLDAYQKRLSKKRESITTHF